MRHPERNFQDSRNLQEGEILGFDDIHSVDSHLPLHADEGLKRSPQLFCASLGQPLLRNQSRTRFIKATRASRSPLLKAAIKRAWSIWGVVAGMRRRFRVIFHSSSVGGHIVHEPMQNLQLENTPITGNREEEETDHTSREHRTTTHRGTERFHASAPS